MPTESLDDKRNYRKFRKFLITSGFLMMKESVYCKLVLNQTVANAVAAQVRKNVPPEGNIQMLIVTERHEWSTLLENAKILLLRMMRRW